MSPKPLTPSGKSFIASSSEDEDGKDGSADKSRASSSRTRVFNAAAERKVEGTDTPQRKSSKAKASGKKPFQKKRLIEANTDRDEASLSSASGSTADRSVLDTAPKRLTFKAAAQDVLKANAADKLGADHKTPVIADASPDAAHAASQEKLLKLQAHVINEMFSTAVVRGVERNVLFLSNAQADVCTESPEHMQKLLDQFPMHRKPKMVINLCVSKGFSEHVNSCEHFIPHLFPGLVANNPPFTKQDSESVALERLDRFMADIILPLAVETNALIFCTGISKMCALTSSLTRVVAACGQRWLGDPPFTLIFTTPHLVHLFASEGEGKTLFWRELAERCKPWKDRLGQFTSAFHRRQNQKHKLPKMEFDLDDRAVHFLIVDSLGARVSESDPFLGQCGPYNRLMHHLVGLLWRSLPVLAIKTGGGDRNPGGAGIGGAMTDPSTSQAAYNFASAGMPVLWIDVRKRYLAEDLKAGRSWTFTRTSTKLELEKNTPVANKDGKKGKAAEDPLRDKDTIKKAKEAFIAGLRALEKEKKTESFDACTIAFFSAVCKEAKATPREVSDIARFLTMQTYKHISKRHPPPTSSISSAQTADPGTEQADDGSVGQSSSVGGVENSHHGGDEQVHPDSCRKPSSVGFLTQAADANGDQHVESDDSGKHEDIPEHELLKGTAYGRHIDAMILCSRLILSSPKTYHVNLFDDLEDMVSKKVRGLATANRLPERNPVEAAPLLYRAWRDYKVAMRMADFHKRWCKILTFAQLLNGWLIIFLTALGDELGVGATTTQMCFVLASAASIVVACNSLLNSRARWQQLRLHACQLKSIIWRYRSRVDLFAMSATSGLSDPEVALRDEISRWRYAILSAADLESSTFEKDWSSLQMPDCPDDQVMSLLVNSADIKLEAVEGSKGSGSMEMRDDDYKKFFSPISPDAYVDLRVDMAIKYSRKKVPPNARLEFIFKILVVSLTIVGTVFSFIGLQRWLTVTVSLAGCCAAWNDFADYGRKSTRHTWTVQALEQTLTWWESLTGVEQASVENISNMIKSCETAILAETAAWMSTPASEAPVSKTAARKNTGAQPAQLEIRTDG